MAFRQRTPLAVHRQDYRRLDSEEFIAPIEAGIREAMENGVLAGYEMVDVAVVLIDGSYHDVDSSEMAFKIAGSMAFKEACAKANPVCSSPS